MEPLTKKVIKYSVFALLMFGFFIGSVGALVAGLISGSIGYPLFMLLTMLVIIFIGWVLLQIDFD